ncbi:MAG: kelch repeat-containing protein [Cyanobacteria bacterium P01_E01_bin.34]
MEPLGAWSGDLPDAPAPVLDAGSVVVDNQIYAIGGKLPDSHISDVYIYDPGDPVTAADDRWLSGPSYPVAVENPAVVGYDGQIYVFGGSTAPFSGAVRTAAVLDPSAAEPKWEAIANIPAARGGATAQVLDGTIYLIGGMSQRGRSVNWVDAYDPLTNRWNRLAPNLQTRRDNPGSAVVDGKIYVFGGRMRNADRSVVDATLQSLEIFDPLTGEWTYGADMPTGRRALSVGTLNDRIQAIGGEAGPDNSAFREVEEYDPLTDTWRSLAPITTPRHGAAFGSIDDIIYVLMGGPQAGSAFTDAVEGFSLSNPL